MDNSIKSIRKPQKPKGKQLIGTRKKISSLIFLRKKNIQVHKEDPSS